MVKIVAKALIENPDGKLLLLRRGSTHPNFPGHLDLPGGEVEANEALQDAVAREISEEVGLKISPDFLENVLSVERPDVVHVLFRTSIPISSPTIQLSWEHQSYEWLSVDDIVTIGIDDDMDNYYKDVFAYLAKKCG